MPKFTPPRRRPQHLPVLDFRDLDTVALVRMSGDILTDLRNSGGFSVYAERGVRLVCLARLDDINTELAKRVAA